MQRISWGRVETGQIVTFRYKGKKEGSVSRKRECLILNTNHRYKRKSDGKIVRLVHAIQLSAIPRISNGQLTARQKNRFFESVAEVRNQTSRGVYKIVRSLLTRTPKPIYRTFAWHILNRNGVFITKVLNLTNENKEQLYQITKDAGIKIDESDF